MLAQVKTAPRDGFEPESFISQLVRIFLHHAKALEDERYPVAREVLLLDELDGALRSHERVVKSRPHPPWGVSVLAQAVADGFLRYVAHKLDQQPDSLSPGASSLLKSRLGIW
jgi:hypothetical protein